MKDLAWAAIIAGAIVLEVCTAPGTALNGDSWRLTRSNPGMVRFTIEHARPGSRTIRSSDFPIASFHGFSPEMLDHPGPAKFEYQQDAGAILCEGKYAWGRGSGSFTLTPNPAFVSQLKAMGFAAPTENDLFALLLGNVNLDFVRAAQTAGIAGSLSDLIELRNHGVPLDFIRDLRDAGYRSSRARDYIELHDHGVRPHLVADLHEAGYNPSTSEIVDLAQHGIASDYIRDLSFYGLRPRVQQIVELHSHGVTPGYLHALHDAGYGALSTDQIIELQQHGVPGDFVLETHALGYRFSSRELTELETHGVNAGYLHALHDAGYQAISTGEVIDLHQHGVPGDFVLEARALGYQFTPRELTELESHGVNAAYLRRLRDSGMQHLNASQITQLHSHGVD